MPYCAGLKHDEWFSGMCFGDDYYLYRSPNGEGKNGERLGKYFVDDSHDTGFKNFWPPCVKELARIERLYHWRLGKDAKLWAAQKEILKKIWGECPTGAERPDADPKGWHKDARLCHVKTTHRIVGGGSHWWTYNISDQFMGGALTFGFDWCKEDPKDPIRPDLGEALYLNEYIRRPYTTYKVRRLLERALLLECGKLPKPKAHSNRTYLLKVNGREYWIVGWWRHEPRPQDKYEGCVEYKVQAWWGDDLVKHEVK